MRKEINDQVRDDERAFYASHEVSFNNIKIEGPADGESSFKESSNISVTNSEIKLRYPFWHNKDCCYTNVLLSDTARASYWYCDNICLTSVKCDGVKSVRECTNVSIKDSEFNSEEFGWKCKNVTVIDSKISSPYLFLDSENIYIKNLKFCGKYSFQYVKKMTIENSYLDTKDAFWHSKNVTVINSTIIGEYLAWFSENLTLINCHIVSTQPLCYCKGLKLINCTTEKCDLAFEYSEVKATINGDMVSIKNPLKGKIILSGKAEIIVDENDRSNGKVKIIINN